MLSPVELRVGVASEVGSTRPEIVPTRRCGGNTADESGGMVSARSRAARRGKIQAK